MKIDKMLAGLLIGLLVTVVVHMVFYIIVSGGLLPGVIQGLMSAIFLIIITAISTGIYIFATKQSKGALTALIANLILFIISNMVRIVIIRYIAPQFGGLI